MGYFLDAWGLYIVLGYGGFWLLRRGDRSSKSWRLRSFASWYVFAFTVLAGAIGAAQSGLAFQIQTGLLFFVLLNALITAPLTLIYFLWDVRRR